MSNMQTGDLWNDETRALILRSPIWMSADGNKDFSSGFYYPQLLDANEGETVEQMANRWTDVQIRMMEIIWRGAPACSWQPPCEHPPHVWWVDPAGVAHCSMCDMVWTCP